MAKGRAGCKPLAVHGSPERDLDSRALWPMSVPMLSRTLALFGALAALAAPFAARAEMVEDVVAARILPGWRLADGTHLAGLEFTLAEGWKTYWRAPGDAGIPPGFDWSGSGNLAGVAISWPVPEIFDQNGMRSIVYADRVVLPLHVRPAREGADVRLSARIALGVCEDICIPAEVEVSGRLPADARRPDPAIAAALAARPLSAEEAGVTSVRCAVAPEDEGLGLRVEVEMPGAAGVDAAVIETADPELWVSEPVLAAEAGRLTVTSRLVHVEERAFALDRSGVRVTLLKSGTGVDIRGCTPR